MILLSLPSIIFHKCADFYCFAMRYQLLRPGRAVRTCIRVNEWLEHDSFEFTKYYFPQMCRFLLFCYEIKQPLRNLAITWMCRFLLVCSKMKQALQNLAIFSHISQVLPHDINKVNFYLVCVLFEHFPVK